MKIFAIDQSMSATGLCMLDDECTDPKPSVLETIDASKLVGFERQKKIIDRVLGLISTHTPDLVVFEGYSFGSRTNNITQIAELIGPIKFVMQNELGYHPGYGMSGNKAEYEICRRNTATAERLMVAQASGSMKKFCLGAGGTQKDTSYLLTVFQRLSMQFDDDNQADAYMHAWMAGQLLGAARGQIHMSNFSKMQQDVVIRAVVGSKHLPKGLSITRVMKLSDDEKSQLVKC